MNYKRILTVQDISCVGQCSLTVALPILSCCGLETAILPSAILSTHTGGFNGFTFRDLTDDIPGIVNHWDKENVKFSAVYTGYLGNAQQVEQVKDIFAILLEKDGLKIVDPAMADNGKLYTGFDMAFVAEMKKLALSADILLPNITEAALLTDMPYREAYDESYIRKMLDALYKSGVKTIILTGVSFEDGYTGVAVSENGQYSYYRHEKMPKGCHGTGDIYSSAFVGALLNGKSAYDSAVIAADFTLSAIKNTAGDSSHWYGAKFEPMLGMLISKLS